MSCYNNIWLSS